MSSDFTGIKVIWPPDGTKPPKHEHDIVFVHGLHHGSVSDWQDENGMCWPAERLSLDLRNTRVLAFGYDQKRIDIQSDGHYKGGIIFDPGRLLCLAIKTIRKRDKIPVPLTLIGHGTGGIVIKSALCYSHSNRNQVGLVLQKTKHVIFLDIPRTDLSRDTWETISKGSSSEGSIGGWKMWSTALNSSSKVFDEIAPYFNITSVYADSSNASVYSETEPSWLTHEQHMILENTNHQTISQLPHRTTDYNRLVGRIRAGMSHITNDLDEIERIRVFLGRRLDVIDRDDHERNLNLHHPGTGRWLFEDSIFRQWATLGETSPILWLTGPEGCGKSVLSSLAIHRLRQSSQSHATAYLMLASDRPRSQYQILTQLSLQLLDYVAENQGGVDTEALLRLPEGQDAENKITRIRDIIRILVSQCPAVFFFIDGLDEVTPAKGVGSKQGIELDRLNEQIHAVLSFLVDLASADNITPVRLWLSSLKTEDISKWMQDFGAVELPVKERAIALDISLYLRNGKHESTEQDSESLESNDLSSIYEDVGCNFLIASIAKRWRGFGLPSESSANIYQHKVPCDIRELYQEHLERLKGLNNKNRDDSLVKSFPAMHILSLLTFAKRPLKLKEMQEALAIINKPFHDVVDSEGFYCEDLTPNDIEQPDGNEIQRQCTPFIIFTPPKEETEDGYLRISHASVLEFLHELASSPVHEEGELRISPNIMPYTCLRYLSQKRYMTAQEIIQENSDALQMHHFLPYAAKYWHKHLDESSQLPSKTAQHFLCSPQFITMTRVQSLLLDGYFNQIPNNNSEMSQLVNMKMPTSFATRAELQVLADDYQYFIGEWANFLQLGVTNAKLHGEIQHCFWGALGKDNFLIKNGSVIESNNSFLLDIDTSRDEEAREENACYFYDTISEDGSRLAVWKVPIQSSKNTTREPDSIKAVRESWYIDGDRAPFRYSQQEILNLDLQETRWDAYSSSQTDRFPLVPILKYPARVPALNEFNYGTRVRAGRRLFQREKGGGWAIYPSNNTNGASFWEDITVRNSWIVWSRRQRRDFETSKATKSGHNAEQTTPQAQPRKTDSDADADVSSDSDSDKPDSYISSGDRDLMSSAEEFCDDSDSASGIDSLDESPQDDTPEGTDDDSNSSDESDNQSESEGESESESDVASDSGSSSVSKPKRTGRKKAKRILNAASSTSSDADDESSASDSDSDDDSDNESKAKPFSQAGLRPRHQFSPSRYCDLCSGDVVPMQHYIVGSKTCTFYQCSPCSSRPGDSYDICSSCFDKGAWCKKGSHLLSRAVVSYSDNQVIWEDGISQDAATPLVDIVAEHRNDGHSAIPSFRYTRRHHSMLHNSRPIIHPTLPLLVYSLDGSEFLFGNLKENTYFTYKVPFEASEKAETSGNACIPVSVSMVFSPCGKYIHLARITARNDSPLYGPLRLSVSVLTIALSSKNACSGKPQILPHPQVIDLGSWPKLVMQLPYAITWTDSHVYLALSDDFLRVFRFTLHNANTTASIAANEAQADDNGDIYTLSKEIPLPSSARSRSVHFFPSKGKATARIILGSSRGEKPQPPVVVYLNPENMGDWIKAKDSRTDKSLRVRDDPRIEAPDVDDDYSLVSKSSTDFSNPTVAPVLDHRFRDWLERGFRRKGIYCPSCFDLGIKLTILRLPQSIEVFVMGGAELPEDSKLKIEWNVSLSTLIEALQADCQFCCYVACRLLTFGHVTHTSQLIGRKGPRCCSQGDATEDRRDIEEVLANLQKFEWKVPPDERIFRFVCQPLDQNPETQSFNKLSIRLPGITMGSLDAKAPFIPTMVTISGVRESGETETMTSFFYTPHSARGSPECTLELYTLPSDAAHETMPTRPLTTSRGQDENLDVARAWLEECQSNHSFCRRNEDTETELPRRLIEIADDGTAKLVETSGQAGHYVALSYCWGQHPEDNRSTTIYNIKSRLLVGGLPRDEFPGAIRDAVTVTEQLGIKFIWVDAFCIVQDDIEDKHTELSKMSQYYRNSYLTIAVSTPRCTKGFIETIGRCENHPENPLPRDLVPLSVFVIDREKDEGRSGKVYAREENPYQLSMEPLNRRAWTLQENLLSPRVLFFGSRVMWFCRHMAHSDGGIEDWSFEENELERTRREFQIELSKLDKGGLDNELSSPDGDHDLYDMWHRIVGTYSQRAMSHSEDKLPAISAVAAEFSRIAKDEYLAGLWRKNLLRDLLWTTPNPTTHRPETWRAPTWSWASVDDSILYGKPPPRDATMLATIEEVETTPKTTTVPFGEVERATLRIKAPCFFQNLAADDETRDKASKPWLGGFGAKGGATERDMLLDALRMHARVDTRKEGKDKEEEKFRLPDEITVAVLYGQRDELEQNTSDPRGKGEEAENWKIWGLVLKRATEHEDVYERVLAFSQIPVHFEGTNRLFEDLQVFDII